MFIVPEITAAVPRASLEAVAKGDPLLVDQGDEALERAIVA